LTLVGAEIAVAWSLQPGSTQHTVPLTVHARIATLVCAARAPASRWKLMQGPFAPIGVWVVTAVISRPTCTKPQLHVSVHTEEYS
jgi:hypothetical protein